MRTTARLLALICFLAILGLTLSLWSATGWSTFTQLPSASLATLQAPSGADSLFDGLGMNDSAGKPAAVDNSFRFGLLPAGPGHRFADSASVVTLAGPALVALALSLLCPRKRPTPPRTE